MMGLIFNSLADKKIDVSESESMNYFAFLLELKVAYAVKVVGTRKMRREENTLKRSISCT